MSIRAIAMDLYKAKQKCDALEKKCAEAMPMELAGHEQELRYAKQEYAIIKKMLDGEKENAQVRKKFGGTGFGFKF